MILQSSATCAPVAQWIEYLASNQGVAGSSPAGRTKRGLLAQLVEQLPLKQLVPGSSPGQPTMKSASRKWGFFHDEAHRDEKERILGARVAPKGEPRQAHQL